jgi:3-deoxy-D-manno-octulosonic acid kinase
LDFFFSRRFKDPAPPGFTKLSRGEAQLWLREDLAERIASVPGIDQPSRLAASQASGLSGRGQIAQFALPGETEASLVLRPYRRGGVTGLFWRDRFLDPRRALSELELYEEARRRGIPSLEVLGAVTRPCRGLGYRHGIITRLIPDVQDLASFVLSTPEDRRAAFREAGRVTRVMHEAGFDHPDLNLKNILIRPSSEVGELAAWVIDFDRGRFVNGPLPESARDANLMRLLRSFLKFERKNPGQLRLRDLLDFARGYCGGDPEARWRLIERARSSAEKSLRVAFTRWRESLGSRIFKDKGRDS